MASKRRRPSRTATTLRKVSEMLLGAERAAVADACRALRRDRLVIGTAGNVSLRVGDLVAASPSGVDYDAVTPELVGLHRLDGPPVGAALPRALERAAYLEWICDVHLRAASTGLEVRLLDRAEIDKVAGLLAGYGQSPAGGGESREGPNHAKE